MPCNTEKIRLGYKSKHKFKPENQMILLLITDGKKWHYLAENVCQHCLEE